MNLNLLRNKSALVLLLLTAGAFSSFSQQDSTKIKVKEDTSISQQDPSANLNGDGDLGVAIDETNGDSRETYLKFDISALSGKGGLVSVDLTLAASVKQEAPWTPIPDVFIEVYGCTNPWLESTITWNNKVASDPEILAEADIKKFATYQLAGTAADATSMMKYITEAMKKHLQFVSFVIKGKQETPGSRIWISDMAWLPAKLIVVQDINIDEPGAVAVYAESLTIAGADNATSITVDNGTLQMNATILPINADIKRVQWSVSDETGKAKISPDGLLTALSDGTVTVTADAIDGSWLRATSQITISGQNYTWTERNIIVNGDFSTAEGWGGAYQILDGVIQITPDKVYPNSTDYTFTQDMKVPYDKKNLDYIFSFKIWASATRPINITMQDNTNGWVNYGTSTDPQSSGDSGWRFDVTPTPTFYIFHVNFSKMLENCTQTLQFNAGASIATLYVDSVSLMTSEDYATKATKALANNSLKIYPNPVGAGNELTVSLATENGKVAIYNSIGQKMMEKVASGNVVKFNVSGLLKGLYIVRLNDGTSQKFIK